MPPRGVGSVIADGAFAPSGFCAYQRTLEPVAPLQEGRFMDEETTLTEGEIRTESGDGSQWTSAEADTDDTDTTDVDADDADQDADADDPS